MRRIEFKPVDNPVIECFDGCAACCINIFERNPIPKSWSGTKRIFIVCFNFLLIGLTFGADWTVFSCWTKLKTLLDSSPPPYRRSDHGDDDRNESSIMMMINESSTIDWNLLKFETKAFEIIRIAYLVTLIVSAVLFVSSQAIILLFMIWRKVWRQTLVLLVESAAFTIQICAPPLLLCLLFVATATGVRRNEENDDQWNGGIKKLCGWQIFAFAITHACVLLIWEFAKLVSLGLCCCCCFTCCLSAWPIYRTCRRRRSSSDDDYAMAQQQRRSRSFAATVLSYMPPESDRGSWFAATKWCLLTIWTFPLGLITLGSCALIAAIVVANRNFIYYPGLFKLLY